MFKLEKTVNSSLSYVGLNSPGHISNRGRLLYVFVYYHLIRCSDRKGGLCVP